MSIESGLVDVAWKVITALPRGVSWVVHGGWRDHLALHHPLYGGNFARATQAGSRHFYVDLGIAPSKSLGPAAQLPDPGLVWESLAEMGLTRYPTIPTQSSGEVVVFEVLGPDNAPIRRVECWKSGLLSIHEQLSTRGEESLQLDILEIAGIVHGVAAGVSRGAYARLLDARYPSLRRVDWFTAVTPALSGNHGQRPWTDLAFPDQRPRGRASNARPWVPPTGYRVGSARGTRQMLDADVILGQFLREMLRWCGYLDFDLAVGSVIESTRGPRVGRH